MVERTKEGTYSKTPCIIFNKSKIYNISSKIYNNESVTKPKLRKFYKPKIKKSFFNSKPDNYLISNIIEKNGSLFINSSIPTLIHLLRIYFKKENTFNLVMNHGKFVYTSMQRIRFFSTDKKGGNIIENTGQIVYFPGQNSELAIINIEKPYNADMKYLYFSDKQIIDKHIENKIAVKHTKKTFNGRIKFDVYEFDFDSNGVVDMLRTFEDCPEEAGDSSDEVYYFNINGEWKSMLAIRSWCNP